MKQQHHTTSTLKDNLIIAFILVMALGGTLVVMLLNPGTLLFLFIVASNIFPSQTIIQFITSIVFSKGMFYFICFAMMLGVASLFIPER